MKKIILFFAVLAAVSVSCNKENPELNNAAQSGAEVKIYATAPGVALPSTQNQVSPKSVLGADGFSVLWEDGDQIKMCAAPKKSQYSSATEQAVSVFTTSLSEESGAAFFSGTNVYTDYYQQNTIFIYPASVEYSATRSGSTVTESVKFSLPDEQVAGVNGNIRGGYNLSSAFVNATGFKNGGIPQVTFKNSCALIRFVLSSHTASDIKSVTVSSSAPLAGYASLNKSDIKDDRYFYFKITEAGQIVVVENEKGVGFINEPIPAPEPEVPTSPQTGDNTNVWSAVVMGLTSLAVITITSIKG